MKKLTCAQMGGMCEAEIRGETPDEMIANGMKHIESTHPDMAASIKSMPVTDPMMVEWSEKFKPTWEATPEEE